MNKKEIAEALEYHIKGHSARSINTGLTGRSNGFYVAYKTRKSAVGDISIGCFRSPDAAAYSFTTLWAGGGPHVDVEVIHVEFDEHSGGMIWYIVEPGELI